MVILSRKPLSSDVVRALLESAGIEVTPQHAVQLAVDSEALFAEADQVSAFMAPRREIGLAVQFHGLADWEEKR